MALVPIPLALGSDQARSIAYATQRLINCYVEIGQPGSKSAFAIYGTPGLKPFGTVGVGPIRGQEEMDGIDYIVSGSSLYSVDASGAGTLIGAVAGTSQVIMANNGTQLAIATPDANLGYIFAADTGAFGQITDPDFLGATSVAYLDGFFLWSGPNGEFQISSLLDGTNYDALDFATAESDPDALLRVFIVGSQAWMMGEKTIEPYYNSGAADFPIERVNQNVILKGLSAVYSPAILDNTIFWCGTDPKAGGGPIVLRATGYAPQVISTPYVEKVLEEVDDLSQVTGFAYKQGGHLFYMLILPDHPALVFDVQFNQWHERVTYGMERWLGNNHCYCYGKHIIGSSVDGKLYELDLDHLFDDEDTPLVFDLTIPTFGSDATLHRMGMLRLDMETGVGLATGQGSAPVVLVSYSDDRGRTYSNEIERSIGRIGEYGNGIEIRRLGQFYSRVFNFKISDPVKRVFIALWADVN